MNTVSDQPHPTGDQPAKTYTIDELAEKLRQARVASMAQFGQSSSAFEDSRPLSVRDPAGYEEIEQLIAGIVAEKTPMGELPAAGDTTPAQRDHVADHATTVTIHEASQRTGISVTTWRRRLRTGKVSGAFLAAGPKGEEWRIPVTALDTVTVLAPAATVAPDAEAVADLQRRVAELEQQLELQRALADERRQALDQLHATMRALGAGLPTPTPTDAPRRRRWGRKRSD